MQVAPEIFKVDDNDMLEILIERPPEKYRKQIEEAVRLCPRQAISITED
jgi:ferredoxin